MPDPGFWHWRGEDLILDLKVQPRASRDEFAEILGDRLKVRISAPPVDGKANAHLVKFVARSFKVSKSAVTILSGETGRDKRLSVHAPKHLPGIIPAR